MSIFSFTLRCYFGRVNTVFFRLILETTGLCVGRLPLMAGLPIPSTADVMGKVTQLQS